VIFLASPASSYVTGFRDFGGRRIPGVVKGTGFERKCSGAKPRAALMAEAEFALGRASNGLWERSISRCWELGAIVGAGIFVLNRRRRCEYPGPAIVLSFVVSGFACAMACAVLCGIRRDDPVAGSAYSYSLRHGWASWSLDHRMGPRASNTQSGAAAVAVGWSGYLTVILHGLGIHLPVRDYQRARLCSPAQSSICRRCSS